ncbi:MAG TPA: hypothetical protein EYO51_10435 [Methylococcaceae bacterium]|nr:hypothetical protein [Methylococcaceae bacterium]HIO12358.1 hypothetical protein [Methylococcales bacterium]
MSDMVTVDVKKGLGLEPLVMVNKLADYARWLYRSIEALKTQPRAVSIVDNSSGYTLNDLSYQLSQIQQYQVNTLRTVITDNAAYSNDVGLHESFRSGQLDKLQREKGELVGLINVYGETADQFDQMASRSNGSRAQKDGQDLSEQTIYSPQYGDALVNNFL